MNILYLPLEFNNFYSARKFSYPLGVGMVEGFEANKIEHLTVPVTYHTPAWLYMLKKLVGDQKFDQVWIEVVHSNIPEHILDWLSTIAPIRVGFVVESLTINPDEFVNNPTGTQRRVDNLNTKLPYLTHMIVTDERDLGEFEIPTMLGIASVPKRLVLYPNSTSGKAIFCGATYGERADWLTQLEPYIRVNPPSAEDTTNLPKVFDQTFSSPWAVDEYDYFYKGWFDTRKVLYSIWINFLHTLPGCAIVNLPHRTNVLSSRVIEGMAAGKPVLSPLMRNGIDTLFTSFYNIIYYETISELRQWIELLQTDNEFRFSIADAAQINVIENHTTEVRVKQILKFIEESK